MYFVRGDVEFGTFTNDENLDVVHYYVKNVRGKMLELSYDLWETLYEADETEPLSLPDGGRTVFSKLAKDGILRKSRLIRAPKKLFNCFVLFCFHGYSKRQQLICKKLNTVLPALSIPSFLVGLFLLLTSKRGICFEKYQLWLYYGIIIISLILHEAGHAISGIASGFKVNNAGILLMKVIPIPLGAYVSLNELKGAPTGEKIQVYLSGIEMNLLLAGVYLALAALCYPISLTMVAASLVNMIMILINLLPAKGLDGEQALSAFLGLECISQTATEWLRDEQRRRKLLCSGLPGAFCLFLFSIILLSKAIYYLLLASNFLMIFFAIMRWF